MQDASAYCTELVHSADRDRYLATLFAPAECRDGLLALYAFNVEVGRVRDVAREPLPGEIRLQWWHDVLHGERDGEASANPVAAALLRAMDRYRLPAAALVDLIEARHFDLYDEPMATMADLESYAERTASAVIALAAQILGADAQAAAGPAGIAHVIAGLLRVFPLHVARRQLYVPADLLQRHDVPSYDIFAGRSSAALDAALAELRQRARQHLTAATARIADLPQTARPAFLPLALVRPSLDLLERSDAFSPAELSLLRRQWLIWRAARNPARIAG